MMKRLINLLKIDLNRRIKMPKQYQTILFDLDGTLVDTSPGIFKAIRHVEKVMGLAPIKKEEMRKFIGPPPVYSYQNFHHLTEEDAWKAKKIQHEYLIEGCKNGKVYPGIIRLLKFLKEENCHVATTTLKKETSAHRVLSHFQLEEYMDTIVGLDAEETLTKADTISIALERMDVSKDSAVLVGDSRYDGEGAIQAGVDFIPVTYGFGITDPEQVIDLNPVFCASNARELMLYFWSHIGKKEEGYPY